MHSGSAVRPGSAVVGGPAQAVGQGAHNGNELGRVEDPEVEALHGDEEGELIE
jgi:hypothetical protein